MVQQVITIGVFKNLIESSIKDWTIENFIKSPYKLHSFTSSRQNAWLSLMTFLIFRLA